MIALINVNLYDFYNYKPNSFVLFDKTIVKVASMSEYVDDCSYEVIDAKNAFALPGLIIGHTHVYGSFMRGCPFPQVHSINFREQLEQLYWLEDGGLNNEASYHSAKTQAMDHIRSGVTTIFDHHASGVDILGSLDSLKKAWVDEVQLRGIFCFESSDRFDMEKCIKENIDFHSKGSSEMHRSMFGMHASMSLSEKSLNMISEAIGDMPCHVHVAESLEDQEECINIYGKRIVERLIDHKLVNKNSIFAHCINIDEKEAYLMAEYGVTAALNTTSNLNTGNGLPDSRLLNKYKINTILGNDTLGTNFAQEIRNAMFAQHTRTKNPWWFGYGNILQYVKNIYPYASKMLGVKLGRFEEGYQADFATVDYIPFTEVNDENIWGHVLDGIFNNYHPKNLWCAGKQKLTNYIVNFDEKTICQEAIGVAKYLWKRIGCI